MCDGRLPSLMSRLGEKSYAIERKLLFLFYFFVQEEDDVLFEKGKAVFSVMGALINQMPNLYRRDI